MCYVPFNALISMLNSLSAILRSVNMPMLRAGNSSAIATAMPGAARAVILPNGRRPEMPPRQVVGQFVDWVADYLIRSAVAYTPPSVVRQSRKKAAATVSIHDGWLNALQSTDGEITSAAKSVAELAEQVIERKRQVAEALGVIYPLVAKRGMDVFLGGDVPTAEQG